jgi:hypothetical protein
LPTGAWVSLSGDWLVIGSRADGSNGALEAGASYAYLRDDGGTPDDLSDDSWRYYEKLTCSDASLCDWSGQAVVDGHRVATAVIRHDEPDAVNIGAAYVFTLGQHCMTLHDFASLQRCVRGEAGGVAPGCDIYDLGQDGNVDITDYNEFLWTFTGP